MQKPPELSCNELRISTPAASLISDINSQNVATPAVVVYEVYKKVRRERGEEMAKLCVAQMQKTREIPIDQDLALRAADLSLEFSLAMPDSLVLATARALGAELITGDADFKRVPGARVL